MHGTRRFLLLSTRYHDPSRLLKSFSRRTQYPLPVPCPGVADSRQIRFHYLFGRVGSSIGEHSNNGIVAAGNEVGMVFLWHYDSSGYYEYYDTDVRISPHNSLTR